MDHDWARRQPLNDRLRTTPASVRIAQAVALDVRRNRPLIDAQSRSDLDLPHALVEHRLHQGSTVWGFLFVQSVAMLLSRDRAPVGTQRLGDFILPHARVEHVLDLLLGVPLGHSRAAAPTIIATSMADSMYARKQRPMVAMSLITCQGYRGRNNLVTRKRRCLAGAALRECIGERRMHRAELAQGRSGEYGPGRSHIGQCGGAGHAASRRPHRRLAEFVLRSALQRLSR